MTIEEEIRGYLEGGHEQRGVDFKGPCECDADSLAKDIMAMSNIQDGGVIIIGVQQEPGEKPLCVGMSEDQLKTYNEDQLKDRVGLYADPYVEFVLDPATLDGKKLILIKVREFEEFPVICKKQHDDKELRKGAIYFRTRTRRPESAEVSTSQEMREIVDMAIDKGNQKLIKRGYKMGGPTPSADEQYEQERGGY